MKQIDVVWDMETGDPDDFLTLLLLLGHPQVNLKAVTITPGGADQVHVVRWAIEQFREFDVDIPIGVYSHPRFWHNNDLKVKGELKKRVSGWHYKAFGIPTEYEVPELGDPPTALSVLQEHLDENTTLITGAPLKNMTAVIQDYQPLTLGRWVGQGGFAGEGVVPPEKQLDKFKGMTTCPTYNFNGAPKHALSALTSPNIKERRLVSKNVCHGVYYDAAFHKVVTDHLGKWAMGRRVDVSLGLIWKGMEYYLRKKPAGKKFHDPLAACCAINPDIGEWVEVEVYREKGEWGSRPCEGTNTWIIIDYDHALFVDTFLGVIPAS